MIVSAFIDELSAVINRHAAESGSDTPDFILAEYLRECLLIFDRAVNKRAKWYGISQAPGQQAVTDYGVSGIFQSAVDHVPSPHYELSPPYDGGSLGGGYSDGGGSSSGWSDSGSSGGDCGGSDNGD